jgi:hypothetical protein
VPRRNDRDTVRLPARCRAERFNATQRITDDVLLAMSGKCRAQLRRGAVIIASAPQPVDHRTRAHFKKALQAGCWGSWDEQTTRRICATQHSSWLEHCRSTETDNSPGSLPLLPARCVTGSLAKRFDRAVLTKPRLMRQVGCSEPGGFKGGRHKPSYRFHGPFRCATFTWVQLSR